MPKKHDDDHKTLVVQKVSTKRPQNPKTPKPQNPKTPCFLKIVDEI